LRNYKNKKIVDIILGVIIVFVFAVAFLPSKVITVYSGNENQPIYSGNKSFNSVALTFNVYENAENVKDVVFTFESGRQKRIELTEGYYSNPNSMSIVEIGSDGCAFCLQGDVQDKVKFVTFTEIIDGVDVLKTCSFSTYETDLDNPW
jgi:hypothetical protein